MSDAQRVIIWERGFPQEAGVYLVCLSDGEQCVTPWADGGVDTWGDSRGRGWTCLTHSRSRVVAWATLPRVPGWCHP